MKKSSCLISVIAFLGSFSAALAMDKQDMIDGGKKSWFSYECASLAAISNNDPETIRLSKYAYEQGKIFYESLNEGKIGKNDVESGVPVGVLFAAGGPSVDFMLGRLSESVMNHTYDDIETEYKSRNGTYNSSEYHVLASEKFREKNCMLIGK